MAKGNGFVRRVDCPAPRLSAASRARGGAAQPGRPARVPAAGALPTAAPAPAAGTRPARVPPSRASPLSPSSPALAGCAAALRAGKLAISGHQTAFWHGIRHAKGCLLGKPQVAQIGQAGAARFRADSVPERGSVSISGAKSCTRLKRPAWKPLTRRARIRVFA